MVTFDQTFIPTGGMELHFDENAEAESSPVHRAHCAHLAGFLLQLLHSVQGTASLKPLYLRLVEGVVQHDCFLAPIGMFDDAFQRLKEEDRFYSLPSLSKGSKLLEASHRKIPTCFQRVENGKL